MLTYYIHTLQGGIVVWFRERVMVQIFPPHSAENIRNIGQFKKSLLCKD